jgi:hypothetical protein
MFYLLKEPPLIFKEALLRFFKGFKEFPFRSYYKLRSPDYKIINFVNTQKVMLKQQAKIDKNRCFILKIFKELYL